MSKVNYMVSLKGGKFLVGFLFALLSLKAHAVQDSFSTPITNLVGRPSSNIMPEAAGQEGVMFLEIPAQQKLSGFCGINTGVYVANGDELLRTHVISAFILGKPVGIYFDSALQVGGACKIINFYY